MAVGQHCAILQIVGYQNSGKTTLVEKLISAAGRAGMVAASIKHHGHGGVPSNESLPKDSVRHFGAGAIVAGVEGDGILQLSARVQNWSLEQIISMYGFFEMDVLFIEGYKQAAYPKVVLIRSGEDLPLLQSLKNIKCVISHVELAKEGFPHYPVFRLDEEQLYVDFLLKQVRSL
ncbi:molybdopterin-guanine dinucleotide biosynthesis protein B [Bacillus fonticola]|uniref:molybdopterin-guanine dinucleotide biosynthesis protein B n=1 Tax=Bacillus fonticola TaxID=2728853 RepID=UPI001474222F|nr:molybdopterin-guanine dinucleotide biosynthesis protein B [Bacillus fonticola]